MSTNALPRPYQIVTRWMFGTALVSWRYMWETTPLHRVEVEGADADDLPPALPADTAGDVQLPGDGAGPLFHRRFRIHIADASGSAADLMGGVIRDFRHFVPTEVVEVHRGSAGQRPLQVGDEFVVEMPGPWDGPVRVVHVDAISLRLATLRGHLEAGQIEFRARDDGGLLVFEIEAWARPATPLVHLLYSRLRLAKEIQLNMWMRFCMAAAATAGGRAADGVHIRTRWVADPVDLERSAHDAHAGDEAPLP